MTKLNVFFGTVLKSLTRQEGGQYEEVEVEGLEKST